jgi:UDP-N-acetylglucosamine diphosphorylase / glucose-1-phosphate thymidylyltransferase / UDP-N-acetylgalactosamine diphosphorylase / glucosamine-1-phosphate N-acetyltransferase / galactosamine-1-phosphate N-acetyltransferase
MVEKPKLGKEPSDIKACGIYILPKGFFSCHKKIGEGQYSFETALDKMMKDHKAINVLVKNEPPSLKYPWHLFDFQKKIFSHMKNTVSNSAKISKNAVIEGDVYIGKGARIFENAVIKGPSFIGDNCMIGNNALIRGSTIENGSIIGANCEVARSIIQEDVHLHSGFVGDSIIARKCRIGAGIITANVRTDKKEVSSIVRGKKVSTGKMSFGAVAGEHTKIGIGARTMPGIFIGYDCTIGPSSVVMENVKSKTKYYSTFHKTVKKM